MPTDIEALTTTLTLTTGVESTYVSTSKATEDTEAAEAGDVSDTDEDDAISVNLSHPLVRTIWYYCSSYDVLYYEWMHYTCICLLCT